MEKLIEMVSAELSDGKITITAEEDGVRLKTECTAPFLAIGAGTLLRNVYKAAPREEFRKLMASLICAGWASAGDEPETDKLLSFIIDIAGAAASDD